VDFEEIARKKNLKRVHGTITPGIIVLSPFEEEPVEWLKTLPSEGKLIGADFPMINKRKPSMRLSVCYRTCVHRDELNFDVQVLGGDVKLLDLLVEFYLHTARGVVLLVDQNRPESHPASREILTLMRSYQDLKLMIAAVDIAPAPNPDLMRKQLELLDDELYFRSTSKTLGASKSR